MKVKTSVAVGCLLDWAAAKSANIELPHTVFLPRRELQADYFKQWSPSTKLEHGGQLIELFGISTECFCSHDAAMKQWSAKIDGEYLQYGPNFLVASMRSLASVHFGEEIEVPMFLMEEDI
jgi:hypothetical protein